MKLISRILAILLLAVLLFSLVGCAECIGTEYENVEVIIVDKYYRPMWIQTIPMGKSITLITHPAIWQITVVYNDIEYTISGKDTYDRYKDKIGQTTIGELEIKTYDDGTIKYDVVSLK